MSLLFGMRRAILAQAMGGKPEPEPPEEPEGAGGDVMALSASLPEVVLAPVVLAPEPTRWARIKARVVEAWRWVCWVLRDAWEATRARDGPS